MSKNVQEVKNLYGNIDKVENNNKDMYDKIEKNNSKMCNEIYNEMEKVIKETNTNMCNEIKETIKETSAKQTRMSYADKVKEKAVMPDVNKRAPLIVKPKEKQGNDKTREELNKNVDPVNLKITSVENRKNGTVVIQSENEEEREKIKTAIEDKLNEGYEIKVPSPIEMKINITGMSFNYGENDLLEKLKKQNPIINDGVFKVIKQYEYKRNNRKIYSAIIQADSESYSKMLEAQRVNIGWERCRVFDGTEVMQCLKCRGYNHKARDCTNEEICLRCHGEHKTKDCDKEQIVKCINCIRFNKKLNMGLDENHLTNSRECEVYQNKLNAKKRRMGLQI